MRDSHRAEAERLLVRAVEEEVRRSGGRADGGALLSRARASLDTMAQTSTEEYEAFTSALDEAEVGRLTFGQRYAREGAGTPLLVAAVAALAAVVADLALGIGTGTAVAAGAVVGVAGAAATVVKVTASHLPAASRRAGALGQPGGPEQLRLAWLTALEVRGIRPFFDQQRVLIASTGAKKGAPQLRRTDKSAAARRRSVLEQSFGQLPEPVGPFAGRRQELLRVAQWVHAARASTETRPTVVVLYGAPGSGRSTLAVRAAHELKDQFRGACVVDLRGDSPEESPLTTRDALLHLLNRLGAPREQLLFRERSSQDQQVRRLAELYHQHLTGLPVTIILDDANDVEQVRTLVPERSDSLVVVTARKPLDLPADLPAWVHQLAVEPLTAPGAEELLKAAAQDDSSPYDAESTDQVRELCGGLPLALRIAGSSLGPRTPSRLAADLAAYGPVEPVERVLWLRYTDQSDTARRLLRRLALAGRASLGAAAAAALLATDEPEATRHLEALSRAGLIDHVRGEPLPPARPRTRLRAGPPPRRGGAVRAHGRAGTSHRELRRARGLGDPPGGRQDVHARRPVRPARLHLAGRGPALAGRRVELHHGGPAARGGRQPGDGAQPPGRAVRLLPAARRPLPPGRDQRVDAGRRPGAAGALGPVAYGHRGPPARRAGQGAYTTGLRGGPLLRGAPRRGRGPGALLARDHPPPPGQSHGGGGEAPGGHGPPGLPRASRRTAPGRCTRWRRWSGTGHGCARRSTC